MFCVLHSANCFRWLSFHNFFVIRFPPTDDVPNKDTEQFNHGIIFLTIRSKCS